MEKILLFFLNRKTLLVKLEVSSGNKSEMKWLES